METVLNSTPYPEESSSEFSEPTGMPEWSEMPTDGDSDFTPPPAYEPQPGGPKPPRSRWLWVIALLIVAAIAAASAWAFSPFWRGQSAAPTPIPTAAPAEEPPAMEDNDSTTSASATPSASGSPRATTTPRATATPRPTPQPTAQPIPATPAPAVAPLSNLYFQTAKCTINFKNDSAGTAARDIAGISFEQGYPLSAQCPFVFQNSESARTGEIAFIVSVNDFVVKRENVGTLAKGNWPHGEYKDYTVSFLDTLKSLSPGQHTVSVEINPDRRFLETTLDDNKYSTTFTVTADRTAPFLSTPEDIVTYTATTACFDTGKWQASDYYDTASELTVEAKVGDSPWYQWSANGGYCVPKGEGKKVNVSIKATDRAGNKTEFSREYTLGE